MHIVFVIANNPSVPLLSHFMREAAVRHLERLSFVAMTPNAPRMVEEAAEFGFQGHWIPFDCARRKTQMLSALVRLYALFQTIRPDVVHSQLFDDSVPALLAARLARVPVRIVTKQDTGFHHHFAPRWEFMDRFNNANATHVLAVSEEAKAFVQDIEGCDANKLHMIHSGIRTENYLTADAEAIQTVRTRYGLQGRFVVGTVARLIEWKGHYDILRAAELVVRHAPEALFVWAGDGAERNRLEALVRKRGLERNILFLGYLPPALMPHLFGAMDVYLHAAFMEPFGYVLAEAMTTGLPVVSTPTGAARDAIRHGENGWLGQYRNPESLAEGVLYYYKNRPPKPYAAAQRTAVEMFDVKKTFSNYIDLYSSAARRAG